ncbi:MAG: response regulator, partial [Myxococcales bacterium]|nr:response regulator [Myxococcales bacterium]
DGLLGEMANDQLEYVGEIYDSGRHLLSLINDILDLSKIEAGKMELHVEQIDVGTLVRNALTIVKEQAAQGGIRLSHTIDPSIETVDADGRKLRQVVYNLLSNAVKFTPEQGSVHVEVKRVADSLELSVADTGIGIEADQIGLLFEPFVQLDGGISRRFEGTGLGLALVKNLVELHGGTIGVESKVGEGSRFWVRIPLSRSDVYSTGLQALPAPPANTRSRVRILVIDDDESSVSLATRWLEREGYEVDAARNCSEAWQRIELRVPDAILLDILLDDGDDGWLFLEQLRSKPGCGTIPVVIVSIMAELGKGLALGAVQVLQKPVSGPDLLQVIHSVLDAGHSKQGTPRILVVDDDPRSVERIALQLESADMAVERAFGGREALQALAEQRYSAVILDLMMPEVSGFDVINGLAGEDGTVEVPIVILTAKSLEPAERKQLEASVFSILSKGDFDRNRFIATVEQSLNRPKVPRPIAAESTQPRKHRAVGGHTILVIEDDSVSRDLISVFLRDAGFNILCAESGEQALTVLKEQLPSVITLDLGLPGMSGFEFLARIGSEEGLRHIPVLVVSANDDPGRSLALGANGVLTKPIRRHELLEVVTELVDSEGPRRPYVLAVDDDPRSLRIISSYLETEDIEVGTAQSGDTALEMIAKRSPDLLLLDLMMPQVSGFDVLARLGKSNQHQSFPILVLTAKDLTRSERSDLLRDVQAIFSKGDEYQADLIDSIKRLLPGGAEDGGTI